METMKRLVLKMGMLAAAVLLSQCALTVGLLHVAGGRLQNQLLRFDMYARLQHHLKLKTDIHYFGDCTLFTGKAGDKDNRSIPAMLQALCPGYAVAELSHPAYHMDLYLAFCQYIVKQGQHPKLVIIPINMRSFSPEWDRRPQYQFTREKTILAGGPKKYLLLAFDRLFMSLGYDLCAGSRDKYLREPVYCGDEKVGLVKDFLNPDFGKYSDEIMRDKLVFFYLYSLRPGHRKVRSLLEIARVLSLHSIPVIFYVMPIDCQTGEEFFPGLFSRRLAENVRVIRSALAETGNDVMDFSAAVPRGEFAWRQYPSEHIDSQGKLRVAEGLSSRLNGLLKR